MMIEILGVLMRWLHIASVVLAIGSVFYARMVMIPAIANLPSSSRAEVGGRMAANFRKWAYLSVVTILGSGLYNFLTKASFPPGYHMWFGIKMLLVLHIFAVLFLLGKGGGDEAKRARWMTGVVISGFVTILISSYLRWISLAAR